MFFHLPGINVMTTLLRVVSMHLFFFLAIATLNISFYSAGSNVICIEAERNALLRFKQDLDDPSNRLASWSAKEDCCKWAGVVCDNRTGHVIELLLSRPSSDGDITIASIEASQRSRLGGKINPSLLELKYLSHLDLSYNNFKGIEIPNFLGSITSLRYLDLYLAEFAGMIPHELGNLSSLRYLSIAGGYDEFDQAQLYAKDLQWLSGLSSLENLGLYFMNLSKASNWLEMTNMLPSLSKLNLSACELDHFPSLPRVNITSLSVLDLSYNSFSSLPDWVFNLGSLAYLDLGENNIQGPIPSGFQNLSKLAYLDFKNNDIGPNVPIWMYNFSRLEVLSLFDCSIQGLIPSEVGNLTSATILDMSNNELEAPIPRSLGGLCNLRSLNLEGNKLAANMSEVFESLSGCTSHRLNSLQIGGNKFFGSLTNQIRQFKNLAYLSLAGNLISGAIPKSLGSLSSLISLSLSFNQLSGTLPESLAHLTNLEDLDISYNLLEGVVSEVNFANLTNLKTLQASGNSLVLKVSPNWVPPFQLVEIELRSWNLGSQFPLWLKSQSEFDSLDLSSTGISDTMPTWFWNISSHVNLLNLSHNQIRGEIPYLNAVSSTFAMIYLGSNQFSGPLPLISSNVTELDLSNNLFSGNISNFLCNRIDEKKKLEILHLGENLLTGGIPDCWTNWLSLKVIKLGDNELTGNIPSSIGHIHDLQSLHLRNNSLFGQLPLPLQNCTRLVTLDLGLNEFEGSIPAWIGTRLSNLMFLSLHSNKFNGEIPRELCSLSSLQILDLGNNNLSGMIPKCVKDFNAMATKPESKEEISYSFYAGGFLENAYAMAKGSELEYDTILSLVAILDLSSNNLIGKIPEELTSLLGLLVINISSNHLTGRIPTNIGDMVSLESLDLSRNQLSGDIPPSLSRLTFLSYLNLSYNILSGTIPSSTQLQSFSAFSFLGNSLCGPPLTVSCSVDGSGAEPPPQPTNEENVDDGDEMEMKWFYLSMVLGFVVGFWGVCVPLLFKTSRRHAYFLFLDHLWYKLCDSFHRNRKILRCDVK